MSATSLTFRARTTDIRLESRADMTARWHIALDHTLFSGSAQTGTLIAVAPSGARLEILVLGAYEEHDMIWHIVEKPLTEGTEVLGTLTEFLA